MVRDAIAGKGSFLLLASTATLLAGCAVLPTNGPTAHQIAEGTRKSEPPLQFQIVPLDAQVVESLRADDRTLADQAPSLAELASDQRVDTIGPGDVLGIGIFEVGVSLFASPTASAQAGGGFDSSAHSQVFQEVTVNADGRIGLPYIGMIRVAGLTPREAEMAIDKALSGKSQTPQAMVTVKTNINNTVFISGDVHKPGRFELTLGRERLLDAIAASSGATQTAEDTVVRFSRHGRTIDERMGFIRAGSPDDLVLIPGDRIQLINRPRSYTTFGAMGKAQQVTFATGDVSLAEAIARAGGPADAVADASAVFLFRYDSVPDADKAGLPKLYRLNMLQPASYLIAQRLRMRDKDVLYFANARLNQASKLVSVLNQLFSPFVTARALGGL